jgi:hypothetical protein
MSRYFESAPNNSLKPYVVCSWEHVFDGECAHKFKVLPDGCADIILVGDRPPVVVGPNLKAFVASFSGATEIVGIRLKPGIAAAVLNEMSKMLSTGRCRWKIFGAPARLGSKTISVTTKRSASLSRLFCGSSEQPMEE